MKGERDEKKREQCNAEQEMKEAGEIKIYTAGVRMLYMHTLHYLILLVDLCISLHQYTNHINMAFL